MVGFGPRNHPSRRILKLTKKHLTQQKITAYRVAGLSKRSVWRSWSGIGNRYAALEPSPITQAIDRTPLRGCYDWGPGWTPESPSLVARLGTGLDAGIPQLGCGIGDPAGPRNPPAWLRDWGPGWTPESPRLGCRIGDRLDAGIPGLGWGLRTKDSTVGIPPTGVVSGSLSPSLEAPTRTTPPEIPKKLLCLSAKQQYSC
jgi:hypothetical protein